MKRYRPINVGRVVAAADDHLVDEPFNSRDAVSIALATPDDDDSAYEREMSDAESKFRAIEY